MRVVITESDKPDKRMKAIFYDGYKKKKTIHFGLKGGSTFIDHKDEKVKTAWIARHKVRGTFGNYMTASSLSYWVLWTKTSLSEAIAQYKKRFNLS